MENEIKKHGRVNYSSSDEDIESVQNEELEIKLGAEDHIKNLEMKDKLEKSQELIAQMRINYMKDINQLRNQMGVSSKLKYTVYKFIDVKYYDSAELANDNVRSLINDKVKEMRDKFEIGLLNFRDSNNEL